MAMRASQIWITASLAISLCVLWGGGSLAQADSCDEKCQQKQDATSLLQVRQDPMSRKKEAPSTSVPVFKIDLDKPPRDRWNEVTDYYRGQMIAMFEKLHKIFLKHYGIETMKEWVKHSGMENFPDISEEYEGIVARANHPSVTFDMLVMNNMLYEMQSPTMCSGVLWALPNGTVLHGRNMDYSIHFEYNGKTRNWPDVTYDYVVYKDKKPLYRATGWPAGGGISTAMRYNGWSFEQNTREAENEWHKNLAAAKKGGAVNGWVARRVMETEPDFEKAVQTLYATNFMAPQYFIMSGAKPWQGAVLTIDRGAKHLEGTPAIQYLDKDKGYLVETNFDLNKVSPEPRLDVANAMLSEEPKTFVSKEHLMRFMRTPLLLNPSTVFSTVMVPATGDYRTTLPDQPPLPLTDKAIVKGKEKGLQNWLGRLTGDQSSG